MTDEEPTTDTEEPQENADAEDGTAEPDEEETEGTPG